MQASILGTPILWIASPSEAMSQTLAAFLRLHLQGIAPTQMPEPNVITVDHRERLTFQLDRQSARDLANSLVLLDLQSTGVPSSWSLEDADPNPLKPATLLMRYPEVYWVFLVRQKPHQFGNAARQNNFVTLDGLAGVIPMIMRHAAGFRTIFDATGLRRAIQSPPSPTESSSTRFEVNPAQPERCGISLEDEVGYGTLNAYFLYGHYCETLLVPSAGEFEEMCRQLESSEHDLFVVEDLELNYPDLRDRPARAEILLITLAGGSKAMAELLARRGEAYCRKPPRFRLVLSAQRIPRGHLPKSLKSTVKPYLGFYDPALMGAVGPTPSESEKPCFFQAPLWAKSKAKTERRGSQHSAPGLRQEIATALIGRCQSGVNAVRSPEEAVYLAVLASEAGRILRRKTLHMSLEALSLRHRMEVEAECMFIGTSNALNVAARMKDIRREVRLIVGHCIVDLSAKRWKRNRQYCNAMVEICGILRDTYHRFDQRDEEDLLLVEYRKWVRKAFYTNLAWSVGQARVRPSRRAISLIKLILSTPLSPVWAYLNLLLRGGSYILVCTVLWVIVYARLYHVLFTGMPEMSAQMRKFDAGLSECLKLSISVFTGFQSSLDGGLGGSWIGALIEKSEVSAPGLLAGLKHLSTLHVTEMMVGYFHLGVFVAWVLQKFSRR